MKHENRQIVIIGECRLQNELLGGFLEQEIGCRCFVEKNIFSFLNNGFERSNRQRLLLIDCVKVDEGQMHAILNSKVWEMTISEYRVLFNLPDSFGSEQLSLKRGVRGFFYGKDSGESLLKGVRAIFHDDLWVSRKVLISFAMLNWKHNRSQLHPLPGLSLRETEVLEMLSEGYANKTIADKLCISPFTVKTHLHHIFKKINVSSRLQAVRWLEKLYAR